VWPDVFDVVELRRLHESCVPIEANGAPPRTAPHVLAALTSRLAEGGGEEHRTEPPTSHLFSGCHRPDAESAAVGRVGRSLWCDAHGSDRISVVAYRGKPLRCGILFLLGAALADKAGDATLATRCRVTGAGDMPNPMSATSQNIPLLVAELPATRADLGVVEGDVLGYLENHIIPWADSDVMHTLYTRVPELAEARPTLVMRNTSRTGTEGIFASSMGSGTCLVIWRNWEKMMVSPDTCDNCHRFAAWTIASDLPVGLTRNYHNGLASEQDTVMGWAMLNQLWKKQGANNPEALQARDRLSKLLNRCAAQPGQNFDIYANWWT
jgi:hypothetical protein